LNRDALIHPDELNLDQVIKITQHRPDLRADCGNQLVGPSDPCEPGLLAADEITIRAESILRVHGYKKPEATPATIRELAFTIANNTEGLFTPSVRHQEHAIESCSEGILRLANGVELRCGDFGALVDCTSAVAFVLTIGDGVDQKVHNHAAAGDVVEALFLETAAWLAIEAATRKFVLSLRDKATRRGLGLTRRFAPGYSDWALSEQRYLFSLLSGTQLPVQLLESGAMLPKMSRSGLYGLRRL